MNSLKQRLPSRSALWLALAACAFPINIWAIIQSVQEVSAWILRMSLWELIGVVSYPLFGALLETLLVFAGFVLLAVILPENWLRKKFVSLVTAVIFTLSIWFAVLQYNPSWISDRAIVPLAIWAGTLALALAGGYFLVQTRKPLQKRIRQFTKRVAPLSNLYLFIDLVALLIVFGRNIF